MLDGYDFFEVYSKAVEVLAEYHGVTQEQNIVDDMRATASAFLASKGLTTKRVEIVYQQVIPASQDTI